MTGQPWGAAPALTDQDRRKVRDAFTAIADPGDAIIVDGTSGSI